MLDPPQPEIPAAIARGIGMGTDGMRVVNGTALDVKTERELDDLLGSGAEVVFARSCFCFSQPIKHAGAVTVPRVPVCDSGFTGRVPPRPGRDAGRPPVRRPRLRRPRRR